MANPTIVNSSTKAVGTTAALTASMPASIVAGNLLLLIAHESTGTTLPAGSSGVTGLNTASGFQLLMQRAGTSSCIGVWWKIAVGSDAAPVLAAASNEINCTVVQISGVKPAGIQPWGATGNGTTSGTNCAATGITATAIGSLILYIIGENVDSNTAPYTAFADATLSGPSLALTIATNSGTPGGGIGVGEGNTTATGATGTGAFTNSTSVTSAPYVVVEILPYAAPTVTTSAATIIQGTAATGNGSTTPGTETMTERGICWGTALNPTTADSKVTAAGTSGSYTGAITSLTQGNALYHFRAYAIAGGITYYGSDLTFNTLYNITWTPTSGTLVTLAFEGNTHTVDWGDGSAQSASYSVTHTYSDSLSKTVGISAGAGLSTFTCTTSGLTALNIGNLPSAAAPWAVSILAINGNSLTSLDIHLNTSLTSVNCSTNQLTSLNVSGLTALASLQASINSLPSLDVSGLTALSFLSGNTNLLTQSAVDAILSSLVASGRSSGTVNLAGTGNAAPSATGLTNKATLESRSWTVTVTSAPTGSWLTKNFWWDSY